MTGARQKSQEKAKFLSLVSIYIHILRDIECYIHTHYNNFGSRSGVLCCVV